MSMGSVSSYHEHGPYQVCLPTVSNDQMARVIVKYLRAHPENLHWKAGQLTMLAFLEAFPCKNLQKIPTEVKP